MNNTNAPSGSKNRLSLASSANEIVVTLWTGASFYLMYATGGKNEFVLFIPLAAGAVAFVWMTYKRPVIAKVNPILSLGVFLLIFSIMASYLFNSQWYELIFIAGNLASAALLFISLFIITRKIELDFQKVLILQSILINLLLPVIIATSTMVWGRLTPELHPNYIGMMCILALVGALSVRSIFWSLALAALPLYSMVAMESRTSMLAAGIATLIILGSYVRRLSWKKLRPYATMALLGSPIVCIVLYFLGFDLFGYANNTFDTLFMVNDEYRGIDSGASGRSDLWAIAINLWLSHPLFGVGFKGLPPLMPDQMPAHNAYLGILAEVGIVGFSGYMIIVGVALYYTLKREDRGLSEYPQRMAILVSYLIYGMLESRAFSFGNSYSLLFLLVAFDSSKFRLKNALTFVSPRTKPSPKLHEPASPSSLISRPKM
jgi:O-antigen ligase